MNPIQQMQITENHIQELQHVASTSRLVRQARAPRPDGMRNAAGWFLIGLGLRIATRPPLALAR
jgi:hypothetical protein